MNYYEIQCDQGSKQWHEARFGRIGGSNISNIIQNQKTDKKYRAIEEPTNDKQKRIWSFIGIGKLKSKEEIIKEFKLKSDSTINTMVKNGSLGLFESPLTGKESLTDGAQTYLIEKITELKYGVPNGMYCREAAIASDDGGLSWVEIFSPIKRQEALEYGTEYEPEARAYFEQQMSLDVSVSGLLVHSKWPELSCSLDGQVRNNSENIEIKCPYSREQQIRLFITDKIKQEYLDQMQLGMAITGNDICHFISYEPSLPEGDPFKMYTQIVKRDEKRIEKIMTCAINFIKVMRQEIDRLELKHFYIEK
jgi:putative phage-type endonuclease